MLELPITVRLPLAEEFPHRDDIEDLLFKRRKANITQGYVIRPNNTPQLPFAFQADININNSRLWELMLALIAFLPEDCCCEYGLIEDELATTNYLSKTATLQTLSKYQQELVQDCSLEFGFLSQSREAFIEIFITSSKYIRFSASNRAAFIQCMQDFDLTAVTDLAFIDEYPKIVEPLKKFVASARRPEDIIWSLNRAFGLDG